MSDSTTSLVSNSVLPRNESGGSSSSSQSPRALELLEKQRDELTKYIDGYRGDNNKSSNPVIQAKLDRIGQLNDLIAHMKDEDF